MGRIRRRTRSGVGGAKGTAVVKAASTTITVDTSWAAVGAVKAIALVKAIGTVITAITNHLLNQNGNPLLAENGNYLCTG